MYFCILLVGECDATYKHRESLNTLIRSLHQGQRFKCDLCNVTFAESATCKRHIKVFHQGQRFCCNLCGKSYTRKITATLHINQVHLGEGFRCSTCNKTFLTSHNLSHHLPTHSALKPTNVTHVMEPSNSKNTLKIT